MTRRREPRRWERPGPAGFLVVDKPPLWTSHDVVDAARRLLGTRQIGHLGTLDPRATGVLPLAVRSATKLAPFLASGGKVYTGSIRLGEETDTLDAAGVVTRRHAGPLPDLAAVRAALAAFVGEIEQVPPMFSAAKMRGVPLHRLAREGREVERPPKRVRIDRIDLLAYDPPTLEIEVACSAGTYVRALASDVGARLGCGGHLHELCRIGSGPFALTDAATPAELAREAERGLLERRLVPAASALGFPVVRLTAAAVRRVRNGGEIASEGPLLPPGTRVSGLEPGGALLAVLEVRAGRMLHPVRVLHPLAPEG